MPASSPKSPCQTSIFPSNSTTTTSHQHYHASLIWPRLDMPNNCRSCFFIACKSKKWRVSKMAYSLYLIGKKRFVCSCPFPALGLELPERLCSQPCVGLGVQIWALWLTPYWQAPRAGRGIPAAPGLRKGGTGKERRAQGSTTQIESRW